MFNDPDLAESLESLRNFVDPSNVIYLVPTPQDNRWRIPEQPLSEACMHHQYLDGYAQHCPKHRHHRTTSDVVRLEGIPTRQQGSKQADTPRASKVLIAGYG